MWDMDVYCLASTMQLLALLSASGSIPDTLPCTETDASLVCAVCESSVGPAVVGACVLIGVLPFLTDVFSTQKKEDYEGRYPALPFDG